MSAESSVIVDLTSERLLEASSPHHVVVDLTSRASQRHHIRKRPKKRKRMVEEERAEKTRSDGEKVTMRTTDGTKRVVFKNDVDMGFKISVKHLLEVMSCVFPYTSKNKLDRLRRKFNKSTSEDKTLWRLIAFVARDRAVRELHGFGKLKPFGEQQYGSMVPLVDLSDDNQPLLSFETLTTVTKEKRHAESVVRYLRRRVIATYESEKYHDTIKCIESIDSDSEESNENFTTDRAGVSDKWIEECCVCMSSFDVVDMVPCSNVQRVKPHFTCKPCFRRYVVETLLPKGVSIATAPCPNPSCKDDTTKRRYLFPAQLVRRNLSAIDVIDMEESESARSQRVALAGDAQLFCACGTVGVVMKGDIGDGHITCPGCKLVYCAKCGNKAHGKDPCPPPSSMLKWLKRNKRGTKRCPNCQTAVSKNGGCNHMTCEVRAGGCGHEFCWLCLGPFPNCGCGHFDSVSQALARRMRRMPHRRPRIPRIPARPRRSARPTRRRRRARQPPVRRRGPTQPFLQAPLDADVPPARDRMAGLVDLL